MHSIRPILTLVLSLMLLATGLANPSAAEEPDISWATPEQQKTYWQGRFRGLRERAALLRRDAAIEWELYADANRRNYRRGKVRHIHRDKALELDAELGEVEAELRALPEQARRAGAEPGWLREVEFEQIVLPEPRTETASDDAGEGEALPSAAGDLDTAEDRAGRNPIFFESERGADAEATD